MVVRNKGVTGQVNWQKTNGRRMVSIWFEIQFTLLDLSPLLYSLFFWPKKTYIYIYLHTHTHTLLLDLYLKARHENLLPKNPPDVNFKTHRLAGCFWSSGEAERTNTTSIGRVERTEESLWFEIHGWPPDPGLNWGELTPTNYGL